MRRLTKILFIFFSFSLGNAQLEGTSCPAFKIEASVDQKQDVAYIVNTLAKYSSLSLLRYKNDLESAGSRVRSVPPFAFFAIVLTDPTTKASLKKLSKKNNTPYKRFCNGFIDEFQNEVTKSCFNATFDGFCKSSKLDVKKIKPLFLKCYKSSKQRTSGTPFAPFIEAIAK
ncbi:MAG: hypothetical protein KGQ54_05550 [Verrucomicrobia bacterium]|nr:hypothetical protein [Verrucomicrobiota bacterium]NDE63679.1 hypothetical protein [Chlamydiota bacterium]